MKPKRPPTYSPSATAPLCRRCISTERKPPPHPRTYTRAFSLRKTRATASAMDTLTAFGALAVTAMMVFYALEERSPAFTLAFAAASLTASAYGFLQGAWPFGVVELVWAGVALRRWR